MKKTMFTLIASGLLFASGLKAQTIQEGMNHLYADRFKSAIGVFEKMLAANPNNSEATYWLGQVYFDMDDNAKARQVYDKALAANGSAPLILVGLGHADLHDNKTAEARQKFEAAIAAATTKKGADPIVLTAIGRANVDAKAGDFNYAIEKLKLAMDKGEKSTETLLQLGNAYRKAKPGEGGGEAYTTYKKALEINPSFAVASLRLAKLFESQKNWELVLENLNDALRRDPKFAPGYFELFYYNFYRAKFPEAEAQLAKYIASSDADPQHDFLNAQLCWASKNYDCAITKAEAVYNITGDKTKPKVYKLLADANLEKGNLALTAKDSVGAAKNFANAKKHIDWYLKKEKEEDKIAADYKLYADILSKTGGTGEEAYSAYMKGVALDTVLTSKIDFLKQGAEFFKNSGERIKEGDIRMEILKLKGTNAGQRDYFDAGFAYYQGNNLGKADTLFNTYTEKWPDETFGWQMKFQIARLNDTTMEKGLAVPIGVKYLEVLDKDTAKNKKAILSTSGYLAQYYANVAKDRVKAIEYLKKMLVLDPTNESIKSNIAALEKAPATKPATPKGSTPPKTSATKPASTKTTTATKPKVITPAKTTTIKKAPAVKQ